MVGPALLVLLGGAVWLRKLDAFFFCRRLIQSFESRLVCHGPILPPKHVSYEYL